MMEALFWFTCGGVFQGPRLKKALLPTAHDFPKHSVAASVPNGRGGRNGMSEGTEGDMKGRPEEKHTPVFTSHMVSVTAKDTGRHSQLVYL